MSNPNANRRVSNVRQRKKQHTLLDVKIRASTERRRMFGKIFSITSRLIIFSALAAGAWIGGKEALRRFVFENPDYAIRDVKFLVEHPDRQNQAHGQRLLAHLRKLFRVIHRRETYASEDTFRHALETVRNQLVWDATMESPHTREALALEERFYQHTQSYFRFITEPSIEPTNNLAEHVVRFVAIHRRITQGTRSEGGRRWCERIWTVIQTCGQQSRSAFEFIYAAVVAHFGSHPAPTLVPNTS